MGKKDIKLGNLDKHIEAPVAEPKKSETQNASASKGNKKISKKNKVEKPKIRTRIARVFREMISELKKVDWPAFRATKTKPGVLTNTVTVLTLSVFFLVIITAFDMGLASLLRMLVGGGS
ncbi:MAG: preprotein translocase subunit SecE [Christensenellaceae bacterium]|jgi:preprotein translocase subunit SecE|nr:preprotein translocase subunit SecE [Christensenellaceae bacterium]